MMLPPLPAAYMCGRQALVVRKAPSRWMASIFFHSAKGNSSIGCTIWMPALLTRMSTPPQAATTAATPALTASSLATSMATPIAWPPAGADLGGRGLGRLAVEVGDGDLGAFARIGHGDLPADAAGGAGDDGNLVLQLHGHPSIRGRIEADPARLQAFSLPVAGGTIAACLRAVFARV